MEESLREFGEPVAHAASMAQREGAHARLFGVSELHPQLLRARALEGDAEVEGGPCLHEAPRYPNVRERRLGRLPGTSGAFGACREHTQVGDVRGEAVEHQAEPRDEGLGCEAVVEGRAREVA